MKRFAPLPALRTSPFDLVVALALAIVPLSYYMGLHLTWDAQAGLFGGRSVAPACPAQAPAPAAASGSESPATEQDGGARVETRTIEAESAGPGEGEWNTMVRRLETEAIAYPGRVAIYLKDLKHDRAWTYQADDLFPSASLIKVPIMVAVFDKIRRGGLSLDESLALRRRDRVGGSGSIKWSRDGTRYTVRQLLAKMIDESDNTATKMLIDEVGMEYLQQQFPKMGLTYTQINLEGMSLKSRPVTFENYTTAREMGGLLEKIYKGNAGDQVSTEQMLELLKHLKHRARLAKGLPAGWEIAHKTGLLRRACHDSAIIFTPQGDFVLTVLTGQNRDYGRAKDFISKLGRLAYRYYGGEQSLYARAFGVHHRSHHSTDGDD